MILTRDWQLGLLCPILKGLCTCQGLLGLWQPEVLATELYVWEWHELVSVERQMGRKGGIVVINLHYMTPHFWQLKGHPYLSCKLMMIIVARLLIIPTTKSVCQTDGHATGSIPSFAKGKAKGCQTSPLHTGAPEYEVLQGVGTWGLLWPWTSQTNHLVPFHLPKLARAAYEPHWWQYPSWGYSQAMSGWRSPTIQIRKG